MVCTNCVCSGAHNPQGARRIRKAAKPPTAAQGTPLQTQSVHAILTVAYTGCRCSAGSGLPLPYNGVCDRRNKQKFATAKGAR